MIIIVNSNAMSLREREKLTAMKAVLEIDCERIKELEKENAKLQIDLKESEETAAKWVAKYTASHEANCIREKENVVLMKDRNAMKEEMHELKCAHEDTKYALTVITKLGVEMREENTKLQVELKGCLFAANKGGLETHEKNVELEEASKTFRHALRSIVLRKGVAERPSHACYGTKVHTHTVDICTMVEKETYCPKRRNKGIVVSVNRDEGTFGVLYSDGMLVDECNTSGVIFA